MILLLVTVECQAQCPNDITLTYTTQYDIDTFKLNYPNCKYLSSINLDYSDVDPITDLTGFQNIDSLSRDLRIVGLSELTNLDGLQSLRRVDDLIIKDCGKLVTSGALQGLNIITGELKLENNISLNDLTGFRNIDSLVSTLTLSELSGLTNLDGLQNLQRVRRLIISDCNLLESTSKLKSLKIVTSDFVILRNAILSDLGGFDSLEFVGEDFEIIGNPKLNSIAGFNKLKVIESGHLKMSFNDTLEIVEGFNSLVDIGDELNLNIPSLIRLDGFNSLISNAIEFDNYDFLEEVAGFSNLKFAPNITFKYNPKLTKVPEFGQLDSIGGGLYIENNEILRNISGFYNLKGVRFRIKIFLNNSLESLPSFPMLRSLDLLELTLNPKLELLEGFLQMKNLRNLIIERNNVFASIPNFDLVGSIRKVGIYENPLLENIPNFSKLTNAYSFNCRSNSRVESIDCCKQLDSIESGFSISNFDSLKTITGFGNLVSSGSLNISNNQVLKSIPIFEDFNSLNSFFSSDNLSISDNPVLGKLEGFNSLIDADKLTISRNGITSIDGFGSLISSNIEIEENENLLSISAFDALKNGYLRINSNSNLISFPSFNSLESAGFISLKENNSLTKLEAFGNLKSIDGDLLITENESLQMIIGFESVDSIKRELLIRLNTALEEVSAFKNLVYVDNNLQLVENVNLQRVDGFQKLEKIGGRYVVKGNNILKEVPPTIKLKEIEGSTSSSYGTGKMEISGDSISSLNGLRSLKTTNGTFNINNTNLKSLHGLENLVLSGYGPPYINDNPRLSDCRISYICEYIQGESIQCYISNNAEGCNKCDEIECLDNYIKGQVFYDFNENKIRDEDEADLSNIRIAIVPDEAILIPTSEGRYTYFCDEGKNYTVIPELNNLWTVTTDSLSYNFNFEMGSEENLVKDFGVIPNFESHAGMIGLVSEPTRCNSDVQFTISYNNTGTFEESGEITLFLDPSVTFVQSDPMPSDITADKLVWDYVSLKPFRSSKINLVLSMPEESFTGTFLGLKSEMTGGNELLAIHEYTPEVICSYDPNDKLVMPSDSTEFNIIQQEQNLTYTIRFQNEGNAEAINIFIEDTLDSNLELSSFRVIDSSFPVLTSINQNKVRFGFENIWLQAATVNEAESHGYVTYSILPIDDLDPGVIIQNEAFIYFDSNAPIQTNLTVNTIEEPTSIQNNKSILAVTFHPNPADHQISVNAKINIQQIEIYALSGLLMYSGHDSTIDVKDFPSGLYLIAARGLQNRYSELIYIDH